MCYYVAKLRKSQQKGGELMDIGKAIKLYIFEKGLKQKAVAEKAGISNPIFNAMLNGKRNISINEFKTICVALNERASTFLNF